MAIADKLQTLINGKQYVVDKVNAKAGSDLKINSTWQSVGDAVEGIQNGGGNTLQTLINETGNCRYLFSKYQGTSAFSLLENLDTSKGTNFTSMFEYCIGLTSIPPLDTSNGESLSYMFRECINITSIPPLNTEKTTTLQSIFYKCHRLRIADISHYNISSTTGSNYLVAHCYLLKALIIRSFGSNYVLNTTAFNNAYHILGTQEATFNPNGDKDGYIYVPASMVDTLKSTTNWSTYADQIRALEDYTVDGTTTGELDESKVNA